MTKYAVLSSSLDALRCNPVLKDLDSVLFPEKWNVLRAVMERNNTQVLGDVF